MITVEKLIKTRDDKRERVNLIKKMVLEGKDTDCIIEATKSNELMNFMKRNANQFSDMVFVRGNK